MALLALAIAGRPYGALLIIRPATIESLTPSMVRVMGALILAISGAVMLV